MDPSMTDADVAWLRTRHPFAAMREASFTSSMPLRGILRNDCRIRRCQSGEIVVREGDYGNSAFLVLSGNVRVSLEKLPPAALGREQPRTMRWREAVAQLWNRPRWPEVRPREAVTPGAAMRIDAVDDRQAIFLQDFAAVLSHRKTVTLGPGELFGEVAAMYRTPQTATVIADGEATLVEVRWQGLRLLRRDAAFAAQLERHYRAHWLSVHLRETPLLRFLPEEAIARVAAATRMQSFGRMEWHAEYQRTRQLPPAEQIESEPLIAAEGHQPTELLLIRAGFARVSQAYGAGHRTTAYLGKGHLFGLAELAATARRAGSQPPIPLQHSLRAVGFVDVLQIPAETFAEHILPYVRIDELPIVPRPKQNERPRQNERPEQNEQTSDEPLWHSPTETHRHRAVANHAAASSLPISQPGDRRRAPREKPGEAGEGGESPETAAVSTGLLEFLVQQRLTNGSQALVIDLERCTRCDDCVRACATTHGGNPRMTRSGPTHGRLQFAEACMHCTDPVCMIGCPTGAIARNEASGTVHISEAICIGCGVCAAACPYDHIRMVEIRDAAGRTYRDQTSGLPILKPTKCDMCQTQPSGPACQTACPHDALVRIDLSKRGPLDAWLARRSG